MSPRTAEGTQVHIAIETSTGRPSIAAAHGDRRHIVQLTDARAHAAELLPAIETALRVLQLSAREIDTVFVGLGPGSYTGLRVGIATALGLALGAHAEILGVPSGETVAFGELSPSDRAAHVLDARQGELYFARFERTPDGTRVIDAPCVLAPDAVRERITTEAIVFADQSAAKILALPEERTRLDPVPSADALLTLGALQLELRGPSQLDAIEPLYLRPFSAKPRRR